MQEKLHHDPRTAPGHQDNVLVNSAFIPFFCVWAPILTAFDALRLDRALQ
jgi:hypothetical protein